MFKVLISIAVLFVMMGFAGHTQEFNTCITTDLADPPRLVLDCANGLIIEAEAAAVLDDQTIESDGPTDALKLNSGAVLIDLPGNSGPFQILTPHAIASVRGTVFIVDVGEDETAVFVVEGFVEVTGRAGEPGVELHKGDGVRVTGARPLIVKQWPEEKVNKLLARFGR